MIIICYSHNNSFLSKDILIYLLDMTGAGAQKILNNAARLVPIGKQTFKTFSVANMPLQ